MQSKTGNATHDNEMSRLEGVRQSSVAVASAAHNQANVTAAEVTYYQGALASAKVNGIDQGAFLGALRLLRAL
jgi:hypothetical protein